VTAYPALNWLITAPTFGKMLAVEMMFSFYFGVYSGTMLGALVEVVPAHVTYHLLLAGLCTGGRPVRQPLTPFASTWLIDHTGDQGLAGLLADVRPQRSASSPRWPSIAAAGHRSARRRAR